MKHTTLIVSFLATLMFGVTRVYAVSVPNFPLCTNPQGQVIAAYDNGTHGIVGSNQEYTGSDRVFSVSDSQVTQCFCSVSGSGIQTNWWKASSLSEDQIQELKNEGWYYVADGGVWGLDEDPFVAQNISYSCLPGGGGIGGPGDGLSDGRSDGRSSCPECTRAPGVGGGDVLGISTEGEVLGLASTGSVIKLLGVFAYAVLFILIGYKLSQ